MSSVTFDKGAANGGSAGVASPNQAAAAESAHVLPRSTLMTFAAPSLPLAALGLPLVVYMPNFFAHYIGLPIALVGLIFMVLRLLDIGFDPLVGGLMDATRSRFGRFRPWMTASAPILMIGAYALFMARPGVSGWYLAGWLAFLYVGLSIGMLAQAAWGATLSQSYHERSRIYTWWQGANVVGMVLVLLLAAVVAGTRPGDPAASVRSMGWFVIVLLPLTFGLMAWRTPEPDRSNAPGGRARTSPMTYFRLMVRPAMARILIVDFVLNLAAGTTGALFLFFFEQARGFTIPQANVLLLTYFIGGLAGAPIWTWLARRIGKHRALAATCVYYVISQTGVLLLPPGIMAIAIPGLFVAGLAYSSAPILVRAMMADAGDEARLATGEDRGGVLFALVNSTSKVGLALAVGYTFALLSHFGFQARIGAHNTPQAVRALEMIYLIAPVIFALIAAAAAWGYKLDARRHGEVREQLAIRDGLSIKLP